MGDIAKCNLKDGDKVYLVWKDISHNSWYEVKEVVLNNLKISERRNMGAYIDADLLHGILGWNIFKDKESALKDIRDKTVSEINRIGEWIKILDEKLLISHGESPDCKGLLPKKPEFIEKLYDKEHMESWYKITRIISGVNVASFVANVVFIFGIMILLILLLR